MGTNQIAGGRCSSRDNACATQRVQTEALESQLSVKFSSISQLSVKGAASRRVHLETIGQYFQVCLLQFVLTKLVDFWCIFTFVMFFLLMTFIFKRFAFSP